MLASTFKHTPTYLNCHVSVKIDEQLRQDLQTTKFYHDSNDESDHNEDEDDDENFEVDEEEVRRKYQEQYDQNQQRNKTNSVPTASKNRENDKRRVARNARESLSFEWFRDGEKVASSSSGENQVGGLTLFPNGTLKFLGSNLTAGEYRCHAKYFDSSGKFTIGPIISQATVVEIASEFYNIFGIEKITNFFFFFERNRFDK